MFSVIKNILVLIVFMSGTGLSTMRLPAFLLKKQEVKPIQATKIQSTGLPFSHANIEIELRYEILNPDELPAFLAQFTYQHTARLVDVYLDTEDMKLLKKGIYVRVRNGETVDIKFNRACLADPELELQPCCEEHSFMLPLQLADLARLYEVCQVIGLLSPDSADFDSFKSINSLVDSRVIDKTRKSFACGDFTVVIDEIVDLGLFLEIEQMAASAQNIDAITCAMREVLRPLTLKPIKAVYDTLLLRKNHFERYLQSRFILEEDKRGI